MSRSARIAAGLITGYLAILANIIYSLASIPLALHYLGREQFGLWAVIMQIFGYLQLLDIGISQGVSRILIDYKDTPEDGRYGRAMATALVAQSIIGGVISAVALIGAPWIGELFDIPQHLRGEFVLLMRIQSVITGIGVATRVLGAPLYAHQRQDIGNYSVLGLFCILFAALWIGFNWGMGIYAMLLSSGVGLVWGMGFSLIACTRLGILPPIRQLFAPSREIFRSVFAFSRDNFLMSLGWQLLTGSPVLIISRALGLEQAAIWSVCNRPFMITLQLLSRPLDYSTPGFCEMQTRNEHTSLRKRYRQAMQLTAAFALLACLVLSITVVPFVQVWTRGTVEFPFPLAAALALTTGIYATMRFYNGIPAVSKHFGWLGYTYAVEGALLFGLGTLIAPHAGMVSVPLLAAALHLIVSSQAGIHEFRKFFRLSWKESTIGYIGSTLRCIPLCVAITAGVLLATMSLDGALALVARAGLLAPLLALVIYHLGLDPDTRTEALEKSRGALRSIVGKFQSKKAPAAPTAVTPDSSKQRKD